jgi:VIT1/CCC1 family predicted Fe2+/Mn2+ transporter
MAKKSGAQKESGRAATASLKNTSVCIVCKQAKSGTPVQDDVVIRGIRAIKRAFNVAANNRLVVCSDCTEKQTTKRADFEKKMALYGGGGLLLLIVFTLLTRTLAGFAVSLVLGLFVAALSLFSYTPKSGSK